MIKGIMNPVQALYGFSAYFRRLILFCLILPAVGMSLWSQTTSPSVQHEEPFSFVGMRLDDLIKRFGTPQSVHAARGGENWQDDVVLVYAAGDFYIYRDRVWQVGIKSAYNIRIGDAKAVALLVLGEGAQDKGDSILYNFSGGAWPLSICANLNADKISAIYVYRSDY
jgi:hypothetical protein